jgi:hypothetical protein
MLYIPIELGQPEREPCPDQYNEASTLICPNSKRLVLQISLQAVFVQLGIMQQGVGAGGGSVQWQAEEPYLPMVASLGRNFDAVRVRNRTKGVKAQVLITVA